MKLDITKYMSNEEYEYHIKTKEKFFNMEHHCCPDAPYWGDGPNVYDDDSDYEDADYNRYYDNLLSYEEGQYIKELDFCFEETKFILNKNGWTLIKHSQEIQYYMLKWLHDRNISFIYHVHPVRFEEYLYLKNAKDIMLFKFKFSYKHTTTEDIKFVINNYGWKYVSFKYDLKRSMYEYSPERMYQWCDENCKGIFIFSNSSGIIKVLFETTQDAVMFKLKWE